MMEQELRNDNFSALRGVELLDLLVTIENYDLEYRKSLNLDDKVTFGIEIEYERLSKNLVRIFLNKNFSKWKSKPDGSLVYGGEINSPIMRDKECYWEELQKICKYLKKRRVITSDNAGGHIHVGAHILKDDFNNWRKFIKTYAVYENVLFRFLYGDKLTPRKTLKEYAPPMASNILWRLDKINKADNLYDMRLALPIENRTQAINLTNVKFSELTQQAKIKNTVEFRCPNSTVEEVVWQNNINALTKLMLATASPNFDEEYIDYKISQGEIPTSQHNYTYNEILLKKVLEFTDLIFDNNQDKIYFLRQYLKNFEEIDEINIAFKSKKFIKQA